MPGSAGNARAPTALNFVSGDDSGEIARGQPNPLRGARAGRCKSGFGRVAPRVELYCAAGRARDTLENGLGLPELRQKKLGAPHRRGAR